VLKQVVTNREYIMQIQILNILKNIFFTMFLFPPFPPPPKPFQQALTPKISND
jgi:hypothetical protein